MAFGCGALIVIALLLGVCGVVVTSDGGDSKRSTDADAVRLGAFDVCKDFVKDRLKAPSTAKFRNFFEGDDEVTVTGTGKGPYTVRSTVDSENSFGAALRSSFTCVVTNTTGDRWRLNDLTLDENPYPRSKRMASSSSQG